MSLGTTEAARFIPLVLQKPPFRIPFKSVGQDEVLLFMLSCLTDLWFKEIPSASPKST